MTARGALGRRVATGTQAGAGQPAAGRRPPRYRLGIVTYNIAANWDVPTILRVCRTVGLAAGRAAHHAPPRRRAEPERPERKRGPQRFADAGIDIWGCGTTCEFHAPTRKSCSRNIETCRRFVQLVADIGGKGVKVRPNGLPPRRAGRADAGADRPVAGRVRPRRPQDANVEIWLEVHGQGTAEPRAHPHDHGALQAPARRHHLELQPDRRDERLRVRVVQDAAAVDQVVPHQRAAQRLSVPRAVPPAARDRLRPRDAGGDPGHAGRRVRRTADALLQGAVDGVDARDEACPQARRRQAAGRPHAAWIPTACRRRAWGLLLHFATFTVVFTSCTTGTASNNAVARMVSAVAELTAQSARRGDEQLRLVLVRRDGHRLDG